jgi:hypothetical protein
VCENLSEWGKVLLPLDKKLFFSTPNKKRSSKRNVTGLYELVYEKFGRLFMISTKQETSTNCSFKEKVTSLALM